MTWTYDDTLDTDKDIVRFLVGDTDTDDQLISDEGIAVWLAAAGSTYLAAAHIAESLAASYARVQNVRVDTVSVDFGAISSSFRMLAIRLRGMSAATSGDGIAAPFVGGLSLDDMREREADDDRPGSGIAIGMHDAEGGGSEELL